MSGKLGRLIREPMLHFLAIGVVVFALYSLTRPPGQPGAGDSIVIGPDTVAQLSEQFEGVWRRPPSQDELSALVDAHLREEVLVREATALSLDRGDAVIRQRLAQKMVFLLESVAQGQSPTDAELARFYQEHADRYETPAQIGFEQVYLGEDPSPDHVEATLAALGAGADPAEMGEPSFLPASFGAAPRAGVDGRFGAGLFEELRPLAPGFWSGPVRSGYGLHLVRLTEIVPPALPALDAIRDRVVADWRRDLAEAERDARIAEMMSRYTIIRPDTAQ